jgi:hypothetical protein
MGSLSRRATLKFVFLLLQPDIGGICLDGQRETGRYNYNEQPDIDLITSNLTKCVAVVFTDHLGNVSLTHFDVNTDPTFLWREAKLMKGDFTVDIVKLDAAENIVADFVLQTLKKRYPKIKNSKGNQDHRKTKNGTLLLRKGNLKTPKMENIEEISPLHPHKKPGLNNPLKEDILEFFDIPKAVLADYERVLNSKLDGKKYLPIVVFDRDWTGQYSKLTPTAQRIVNDYSANKLSPADIIKIAKRCMASTKHNMDFVENRLVSVLNKYIEASKRLNLLIEEQKKPAYRKSLT